MASVSLSAPNANLSCSPKVKKAIRQANTTFIGGTSTVGLWLVPKLRVTKATERFFPVHRCFKKTVSCSIVQPETLQIVRGIIAEHLSVDENIVSPQTRFVDLGADSLDTAVQIMMALDEKFEVSTGDIDAENISTVQEAADLIEKMKVK